MEYIKRNSKWFIIILALVIVIGSLTGVLIYEKVLSRPDYINKMQSQIDDVNSRLYEAEQENESRENFEAGLKEENSSLENKVTELESQLKAALLAKKNREEQKKIDNNSGAASGNKIVYLTFDDGPSANTPKILKVLNENGVKATFFVINGSYNNYMKDIVDEGHAIALHTYSHNYSKVYSSENAYFEDLEKISKVVKDQTGIDSKIIRFPGGSSNTISKKYCTGIMTKLVSSVHQKGYKYYDWNCSIEDSVKGAPVPVSKLMSNLKSSCGNNQGSVMVLMHDTNRLTTTVDALPQIIAFFRDKGFTFAVIDETVPEIHHNKVNN